MTNLEYLKDKFLNHNNWNEQNWVEVHPYNQMLNSSTGFRLTWNKISKDGNLYELESFLTPIMLPIPFEEENTVLIETTSFSCAEDCWNYFEPKIKQYLI